MVQEPFELERYFAEHEFSSKYLLCASDCESYSIGDLLALEPGATAGPAATPLAGTATLG